MITFDSTILAQVIAKALSDAADHPRWVNAINRAAAELESNPYIERDTEHGGLLIGSPSGKVYTANGICQCEAYAHGNACWHRAAARLVRRYDEAIATESVVVEKVQYPYPNPRNDYQNWRNESTRQIDKANMRAELEQVQARRAAYRKAVADMDELFA